MRGRKSKDVKERATEIKEQAREVAGQSGEALKEFAAQTGSAAKEFATKASEAAKELVEQIEKAAKGVSEEEEPRRGRRLLKATLAIGAGVLVLGNERARNAISSVIRRNRGRVETPEIWRPEATDSGNGARAGAATETTP
jgi:cell division septum initiation protein DivIVA